MEAVISRIDNNYKILKFSGTRTEFATLIENNPGILIFKFTADWCGPCKKELPFFETLKKDYANKNIKFVSVCVWDQKTSWKKFLEEKKIAGEQLFIEGQENSFVENYMVRGVPTFILIDKEGNIITNKVERPSEKELRTRFDQLIH